jgi:hypothetical protein
LQDRSPIAVAVSRYLIIGLLFGLLGLLWDIRSELKALRSEQVKNARYALPDGATARLSGTESGQRRLRGLESSVRVEGSVEIETTNPIPVSIEDQPIGVSISR